LKASLSRKNISTIKRSRISNSSSRRSSVKMMMLHFLRSVWGLKIA